jgi:hypothetical protein
MLSIDHREPTESEIRAATSMALPVPGRYSPNPKAARDDHV